MSRQADDAAAQEGEPQDGEEKQQTEENDEQDPEASITQQIKCIQNKIHCTRK